MKKGLLSILAVALTIVSCQNYDDQFVELTGLVKTLSAEVAGITKVQSDLTALSTLVGTLSTSLEVAEQTTQISNITSGLASATTQIEALEELLGQVKTAQELTAVNSEVVSILAGVNTLLTKNASLQADLNIVDSETLVTAQELILIGDQTPSKYILNGAATVRHTTLTPAEIITANQLTAKLISVTGAVTVSGTVDLSGLTSLLAAYTIEGSSRPIDQTITTIGGIFTLNGNMGDVSYPNLRNITGNVVFSANEGEVTNLDLGTVATTGGTISGGTFTSTKTLSFKSGAFIMAGVAAQSATLVELGQTTIPAGNLTISAVSADTINVNSVVNGAGGNISVTATGTTNVFFNSMTSSGAVVNVNQVAQFHIPALTTSAGGLDINADIVAATALTKIETGAADFDGTKSIDLTAVTEVKAALTLNNILVNMPLAQFSGAGVLTSNATSVIVGGVSDADMNELNPSATHLTLISQNANVTLDATENANLLSFTATASGTGNISVLVASAAPAMTNMTVANFKTITANAVTTLVTATLTGTTQDIDFQGNTGLKSLATNYITMLEAGNALNYSDGQEVKIINNDLLKAVDLTTVGRLDDATITGNAVLAAITAPSSATNTPLTGGAGGGVILFTVKTNNVSVTIIPATAAVAAAGGTAAIPYGEFAIANASLLSWKNYIAHNNSAVQSSTYDLDFVGYAIGTTGGGATTFNARATADQAGAGTHTFSSTINSAAELAIIR